MSSKDTLLAREKQRAQEEADSMNSFTVKNYQVYIAAIFLLVMGTLVSGATEGWNIYRLTMNGFATAGGILLIEFISIHFGGSCINDIRFGIFSADKISQLIFVFKLMLYLGATTLSISLTLDGAPEFYAMHKQEKSPPLLINVDSIGAIYDGQIMAINENISSQESTTWKGSITRQANSNLAALYAERTTIADEKKSAIESAESTNTDIQKEWDQKLAREQSFVWGFAGLGEIIKIISLALVALFKEGRDHELGIHKLESTIGKDIDGDGIIGKPKGHRPPGYYPSPAGSTGELTEKMEKPVPTPRRPIGFKHYSTHGYPGDDTAEILANLSYTASEDEMEDGVPMVLLKELRWYADAKRQYDSYNTNSGLKPETRERNQKKFQRRMNSAVKNLAEMGYEIYKEERTFKLRQLG